MTNAVSLKTTTPISTSGNFTTNRAIIAEKFSPTWSWQCKSVQSSPMLQHALSSKLRRTTIFNACYEKSIFHNRISLLRKSQAPAMTHQNVKLLHLFISSTAQRRPKAITLLVVMVLVSNNNPWCTSNRNHLWCRTRPNSARLRYSRRTKVTNVSGEMRRRSFGTTNVRVVTRNTAVRAH